MSEPAAFDLALRTRLVYGHGSVARLGELAREVFAKDEGAKRVLLVTDPGVAQAGHAERGEDALRAAGFEVQRFEDVRENPTTADVDRCLLVARDWGPELIVGLGGGSSMDVAKGTNFLFSCGGRMQDYWGVGKAGPMLPLIAVPTTAGTGSEAQSFALIADEQTHQKMACGDPHAAPRIAILDPELTVTKPRMVTACTGLDAIGHAIETAVTCKRNAVSSMFSREAFRYLARAFPRVLSHPEDLEARGDMQRGAAFAGFAIENSMLGAAHSMANPLTKYFGLPHGQAVAMALPHVVAFNAADEDCQRIYGELAVFIGGEHPEDLVQALQGFVREAGFPTGLSSCGVDSAKIGAMSFESAQQWTAQFNPRDVDAQAFTALFESAMT